MAEHFDELLNVKDGVQASIVAVKTEGCRVWQALYYVFKCPYSVKG